MIKKCLNTENTIDDGMFFLNKEFCANGISLRVKIGISLLDEKHLVDKTIFEDQIYYSLLSISASLRGPPF